MAKKPTGTAVASFDEELARMAGVSTALAEKGGSSGGGKFFSTRAGVLAYDDVPFPGNQMLVIIGAWCLENVYYEGKYDPDNRTPPTCFAFCADPSAVDEMGPHEKVYSEDVFEAQHDTCEGCPKNEWGSADTGRGKACSNRRRLSCLSAGEFVAAGRGAFDMVPEENPEHYAMTEPAYLKLPVMSGKAFDAYVKEVASQRKRPLLGVYTRVFLTPDSKSQFRVNFEYVDDVPDDVMVELMKRRERLAEDMMFPYSAFEEEAEAAKPAKTAANKKLTGARKK